MEWLTGILFIGLIVAVAALAVVYQWWREAEARAAECEARIEQMREGLSGSK